MPTYSDWIQDPDYTVTLDMQGVIDSTGIIHLAKKQITVDGARQPAEQSYIDQLITDTVEAWGADNIALGNSGPGGAFSVGVNFVGGAVGPWSTVYNANRGYGLTHCSAYNNSSNVYVPTVPPGASGWEWESGVPYGYSDYSTVVGATWDFTAREHNFDSTINGPATGSWQTHFRAVSDATFETQSNGRRDNIGSGTIDDVTAWGQNVAGPILLTVPQGAHLSETTHSIDVTAYLYGPAEAGYFAWTRTWDGSVSLGSYSADEKGVGVGATATSNKITYTLRPPRYRLVYPDPPTTTQVRPLAHQRGYQRGSDGQGFTGGARGMQKRSRQSSLRGGSFL